MRENQLSRYGAIANSIPLMGPNAKFFIVGATTLPSYSTMLGAFGVDKDGGNRTFPTLAALIADNNEVTARGDVVIVLSGHTETLTTAAAVNINDAGLTILGLGNGANRPTFTFTTNVVASFNVIAANTLIRNIRFVCGVDNQTAMVNVTAADVIFDQCEFVISNGTVGAAIGILTAATADRLTVTNSRFVGPATNAGTTCAACIQHEAGVDYVIKGNYFTGKMTQAIKNVAAVLRGLIDGNRFVIATGTVAITISATSTPFICDNRINVPSGTAPIVCAAGFVAGNIYSAAPGVTAGAAITF